jgi:hypothetical protein
MHVPWGRIVALELGAFASIAWLSALGKTSFERADQPFLLLVSRPDGGTASGKEKTDQEESGLFHGFPHVFSHRSRSRETSFRLGLILSLFQKGY